MDFRNLFWCLVLYVISWKPQAYLTAWIWLCICIYCILTQLVSFIISSSQTRQLHDHDLEWERLFLHKYKYTIERDTETYFFHFFSLSYTYDLLWLCLSLSLSLYQWYIDVMCIFKQNITFLVLNYKEKWYVYIFCIKYRTDSNLIYYSMRYRYYLDWVYIWFNGG